MSAYIGYGGDCGSTASSQLLNSTADGRIARRERQDVEAAAALKDVTELLVKVPCSFGAS